MGQRRAIIVDTGPKKGISELLNLLADRKIESIEWLLLSHNDGDHINGTEAVLQKYASIIKKIGFLKDRSDSPSVIRGILEYQPRISLSRLEVRDSNAFEEELFNERGVSFKVLFPTIVSNYENQKNNTCAVFVLCVGPQRLLFSGDAPFSAWRDIITRNGSQRLRVNVLTVPHHGGLFVKTKKELNEYHTQLVKTDYAVVSFASNRDDHPRSEVIQSFVQHGVEIFCTQRAKQCGGVTDNVECCGTIIMDIGQDSVVPRNLIAIQKRKQATNNRLCC